MRIVYIVLATALFGLYGCNTNPGAANGTSTDTTKAQPKVPPAAVQSNLNDAGTQLLMSVVGKYYDLKNALVASEADKAFSAAVDLGSITDSLKSFLQKDAASPATLKPYLDTIISQSKIASSVKDESCEKQRLAFGPLSSALYGLLKNVDLKNAHVYQEFCPMAFNEKGAHWLSDDSDIKNPYFGKKMLECGEVTDVIR